MPTRNPSSKTPSRLTRRAKRIGCPFFATIAYALLFNSADIPVVVTRPAANQNLRVIAYNTQLLPLESLNTRANGQYRAKKQAALLCRYDIVGLSEVFRAHHRSVLLQAFKKAWGADFHAITASEEDQSLFGLDSGLILLTRFPILQSHTLTFGNDSRLRDRGFIADGYAKKGALHARIAYTAPSKAKIELDCFVTHLESQDSAIRNQQIAQLTAFVKEHASPTSPILILGDFNIIGDSAELADPNSQYRVLRRELDSVRSPWTDAGQSIPPSAWGTASAEIKSGGARIDYIFHANPIRGQRLFLLRAAIQAFPDPHVGYLSDHGAIEAEFTTYE
jgi:endonuclease/exonuclease/phosphatase family metal-dependent hydrolase